MAILDAEFREMVRHAIPLIIPLLSHGELNVRRAGSDACQNSQNKVMYQVF